MVSSFHSNLQHLNDCREKLKERYDKIDDGQTCLESISICPNNAEGQKSRTINRIAMDEDDTKPCQLPQQKRMDGTEVCTIECLYEVAIRIQPTFRELISAAMAATTTTEDELKVQQLVLVPLKDRQRTEQKFKSDYSKRIPGPSCSWIYDVVRCSIICSTPSQVVNTVHWFQENAKVVKLKNRFSIPSFNGYRDILLYVEVKEDLCRHICEVQVHLKSIWELSEHLDSYISYQYFRNLFGRHCGAAAVNESMEDLNTIFLSEEEQKNIINKDALDAMIAKGTNVSRLLTMATALEEYMDELDMAFPLLERALALQTDRDDDDDLIGSGRTWERMAQLRLRQGDLQEALDRYHCALDVQNEALGEHHPHVGMTLNNIANILAEEENADEALQYYQLAIDIQERTVGADHPETAASLLNMASMLQSQGHLAQAMHKSKRALKIFQKYLKEDHHYIMDTIINMATVRYSQDQLEESIELYQEALVIAKRWRGAKSFQVADILYKTAMVEREAGNWTEALQLYEKALSIYTDTYGIKHPKSISAKRQVQRLRYSMKEEEEEETGDQEQSILSVKKAKKDGCAKRRCIIS